MRNAKTSPPVRRKTLFVDARIQGALLVRVAMYWIFALMAVTLMLLAWRIVKGPARVFYLHLDDMWFFHGPALIASFLLLPVVLVDVVKVSNRIVGPLVRLRRGLHDLAQGKQVQKLHFRQGDYWQEVAEDFNALVDLLEDEPSDLAETDDEALAEASGAGH